MRKFWILLFGLVLVVAAANHAERGWRFRRAVREGAAAARPGPLLPVREEDGPGGHLVLTLDEPALSLPGEAVFRFSDLEAWLYDPVRKPEPPPALAKLHGRKAAAAGFVHPAGGRMEPGTFFLVPSARSEGGEGHEGHEALELPGLNHRVLVRWNADAAESHGRPVLVRGRFLAEPDPDAGALVRMEAESVEPAGDPPFSLSAEEASRLPRFDYFWLEDLAFQEGRGLEIRIPSGLAALEGRRVAAEGYAADRNPDPPPTFLLARDAWDGCCGGVQPTHFTAVLVGPAAGEPLPSPWAPHVAYAGILRLTRKPDLWAADGIARLEDAKSCPVLGDVGLFVPLWLEIALLALAAAAYAVVKLGRAAPPPLEPPAKTEQVDPR